MATWGLRPEQQQALEGSRAIERLPLLAPRTVGGEEHARRCFMDRHEEEVGGVVECLVAVFHSENQHSA